MKEMFFFPDGESCDVSSSLIANIQERAINTKWATGKRARYLDFPVVQMIMNLPAIWETRVQSLGQDLLEKGTGSHSSILAWRIPWAEELGRLQSMGSQRVRHDWSNLAHAHSIVTHGEKLKALCLRWGKRHSSTLFNLVLEILAKAIRQEK